VSVKSSLYDALGGLIYAARKATTDPRMDADDSCVLPRATYSPWQADSEFDYCYNKVKGYTLVDKYRLWELWTLVHGVHRQPGSYVEAGTWRGGSALIIAYAAEHGYDLWAFDTFSGIPAAECIEHTDIYRGGEHCASSLDACQALPVPRGGQIHIIKGVFPESAPHMMVKFMHIDVDTHNGTANALAWAANRMTVGGVIVVDDYGFCTTRGARLAVDEFDDSRFTKIHNLNGHAVLVKHGV